MAKKQSPRKPTESFPELQQYFNDSVFLPEIEIQGAPKKLMIETSHNNNLVYVHVRKSKKRHLIKDRDKFSIQIDQNCEKQAIKAEKERYFKRKLKNKKIFHSNKYLDLIK